MAAPKLLLAVLPDASGECRPEAVTP